MKTLDRATAVALLREIVAELGDDWFYTEPMDGHGDGQCRYWHGHEPGCIVGWVLARWGWRPFELLAIEKTTPLDVDGLRNSDADTLTEAQRWLWKWVTPEARLLLYRVQRWQDKTFPWGECLERAGVELPLLAKVS